jgi:hypothetical protein
MHQPTSELRKTVSALKAFGHTHVDIAKYLHIDDDTLVKYYADELDNGLTDANFKVANKLFKKAYEDEDVKAQIFWLKTRARWREKDPEDMNTVNNLLEKIVDKLVE